MQLDIQQIIATTRHNLIRRCKAPAQVGKLLGILGPENQLRCWLNHILSDWWTKSFILLLIFLNVNVLMVQAWDSNGLKPENFDKRKQQGNNWTDFVLLA